jgi:fucose permease
MTVAKFIRGPVTWYCYLLLSFFIFMLTIQGNVIPFLKSEFNLSYRIAGLHASAIAVGAILVGLIGDRLVSVFGRRVVLVLGALGCVTGAVVLCLAWTPLLSIAGCGLIGFGGTFIPAVSFAILSDLYGGQRDLAINEAAAIQYGFAATAPLLASLCISQGFGWRGAVLIGGMSGAAVILSFCRRNCPNPAGRNLSWPGRLPSAYWAHWCAIGFVVAIEFCVLIWSPEYLERVINLSREGAAAAASAFILAMFIGRAVGSQLARIVSIDRLLISELGVALLGFIIYWGFTTPITAVAGLVVLGIGVSLLFPLTVSLAIGAAGMQSDAASARVTLAFGVALLLVPALLGDLADRVGLRNAYWLLPLLIGAALLAVAVGRLVEKEQTIALEEVGAASTAGGHRAGQATE